MLGALILAVFLASLDTTIISTALPTIAGEFNAFESFAWVGTAYIVTSTIATPLLGKLSDIYGRRLIFQIAMAVFLVGSVLCGFSQNMGQLIASRAVQGLGGGAIQALAFSILGDILPPRERGRYIGYFTIAFAGSVVTLMDHRAADILVVVEAEIGVVAHFPRSIEQKGRRIEIEILTVRSAHVPA